jgi:hypothetical protein
VSLLLIILLSFRSSLFFLLCLLPFPCIIYY